MKGGAALTVRDGAVVEVLPLEHSDRAELAAAVGRLSAETRYLRFAAAKPRLTERELDHLTDLDHHGREALLAIDPRTRNGVAVVRYVEVPGEPDVVEVAATVADEWQRRGLGGAAGQGLGKKRRVAVDVPPRGLDVPVRRRPYERDRATDATETLPA